MGKKLRFNNYSTNPDWNLDEEENEETLEPADQRLVVYLDKKQRRGKMVTIVDGFRGNHEDLKDLGRSIQKRIGTGGSAKNGLIVIQGNHIDKIMQSLSSMGYENAKRKA